MNGYIGVTSREWFMTLSNINMQGEINFWRKDVRAFKCLKEGDSFFFLVKNEKGRKGERKILGKAVYIRYETLTIDEAWNKYKSGNGYENQDSFLKTMKKMFNKKTTLDKIGCIILSNFKVFDIPVYLSELDIVFEDSIVSGKTIRLNEAERLLKSGFTKGNMTNKLFTDTINNNSIENNSTNEEEFSRESKEQQDVQNAKSKSKEEIEKLNNRKPKKLNNSTSPSNPPYPTEPSIKKSVIENSGYQCEYGQMKQEDHITFVNTRGVQYMEGHHIIPMSAQESMFPLNIDRTENIISLCPTCHRAVHYAEMNTRKEMIKTMLESRKEKFKKSKITITLENLLKFYMS